MSKIIQEFERLRVVFEKLGVPLNNLPSATDEQINAVQVETGIDA